MLDDAKTNDLSDFRVMQNATTQQQRKGDQKVFGRLKEGGGELGVRVPLSPSLSILILHFSCQNKEKDSTPQSIIDEQKRWRYE